MAYLMKFDKILYKYFDYSISNGEFLQNCYNEAKSADISPKECMEWFRFKKCYHRALLVGISANIIEEITSECHIDADISGYYPFDTQEGNHEIMTFKKGNTLYIICIDRKRLTAIYSDYKNGEVVSTILKLYSKYGWKIPTKIFSMVADENFCITFANVIQKTSIVNIRLVSYCMRYLQNSRDEIFDMHLMHITGMRNASYSMMDDKIDLNSSVRYLLDTSERECESCNWSSKTYQILDSFELNDIDYYSVKCDHDEKDLIYRCFSYHQLLEV